MRCVRSALPWLLALFLNCGIRADAASLAIAPVGLDLPATQKTAKISLANKAGAPLNVQIRIFSWQQADGKDVLLPTQDVVVSPPATTIPPGQTYVIRVARLAATPVVREESYRLVIDEIPSSSDDPATRQGVAMVLRTSLPVFFAPASLLPDVRWHIFQESGKLIVEAQNAGSRHVKLVDLAAESDQRTVLFGTGLTGYLLPGSTRRFSAPLDNGLRAAFADGRVILLKGRVGNAALQESIHVATP